MTALSKKFSDSKTKARCKYCKRKGFHWADTQYGWRLFNKSGKMHTCRGK